MGWEAWFMIAIMALVLAGLTMNRPPDVILVGAVILAALAGIVTPKEALEGYANTGMLTVAALFVIAAAMRETGALDTFGRWMLGGVRTEQGVLRRMAVCVTASSGFLNNTPIVAMFIAVLNDWCRKNNVSPSRLLIPLSYMAILGGTCTLIGTSTNLVVDGMMEQDVRAIEAGLDRLPADEAAAQQALAESLRPIGLFELSWVGVPYAIVGIVYLMFAARWLLPDRKDFMKRLGDTAREYLVNMQVETGCPLIGKGVEEAGLRHLTGLFLIEIARDGEIITPVGPKQILKEGDVLTFTGVVDNIVELERIPAFVPVADQGYIAQAAERRNQMLCEAVISNTSPLIGESIRAANFRATYNAAVIAVSRGGERLKGRVGDIVLRNGDTLLLQTGPHFRAAHRDNPDFFLVSGIEDSRPVRHDKAWLSLILLGTLIVLMATNVLGDTVLAAFLVAGVMVGTRCISASQARQSLDWQTLITIGAALGLGNALVNSGLVQVIAGFAGANLSIFGALAPYALLAIIYFITTFITETVTNNAAAALMYPFAVAMALSLDIDPRPLVMAVTFAASASFVTPIGYQTNLMVYGPGGYRFSDFVRVGLPLSFILLCVATVLIPLVWPF